MCHNFGGSRITDCYRATPPCDTRVEAGLSLQGIARYISNYLQDRICDFQKTSSLDLPGKTKDLALFGGAGNTTFRTGDWFPKNLGRHTRQERRNISLPTNVINIAIFKADDKAQASSRALNGDGPIDARRQICEGKVAQGALAEANNAQGTTIIRG